MKNESCGKKSFEWVVNKQTLTMSLGCSSCQSAPTIIPMTPARPVARASSGNGLLTTIAGALALLLPSGNNNTMVYLGLVLFLLYWL